MPPSPTITTAEVEHFGGHGWLLTDILDTRGVRELRRWVDEVAAWPADGDGWLQYHELTDEGAKLCRSENFLPFHPPLRGLLSEGPLLDIASALLAEPAVLYKEKINYKLPGGAGYSAHQDAPAYRFVESHVSAMLAVDDATEGNGCLEVVDAHHTELLPTDHRGCIDPDVVARLAWRPVEVRAGQAPWFHSRTPHRSGPNTSDRPRRAIYPTYNAAAEGDLRDDYYRQKLAEFAQGPTGGAGVQVSLIGDFEGRPVT